MFNINKAVMMNITKRRIIIFTVMMFSAPFLKSLAQTVTYPGSMVIENQTWTSGNHKFQYPATIVSPGSQNQPVTISQSANVKYQSGNEIVLREGFHVHSLNNSGQFQAKINPQLEMVLVTPDPATSIINGIVHVPKWEKLEIALKLPQEYQMAIDNFFANYWNNQVNAATDLNPYAFDSLEVRFELVKPDGVTQLTRWAFFMRPGRFADNAPPEALPEEDSDNLYFEFPYRFRFSPDVESNGNPWSFNITIRNPQGLPGFPQYQFTGFQFVCDPPLASNHGFLKVATNNRNLVFDDGTPFFALGTNLADVRHAYLGSSGINLDWRLMHKWDFDLFLRSVDSLSSAGGNYFRAWLFKYTFAPEFEHLGVYDAYDVSAGSGCHLTNGGWSGNRQGNRQWHAWMFDEFLERCRSNGVYMQLCVEPANPIVAYQTYIWGDHAYVKHFVYPTAGDANFDGEIDNPYDASEFFVSSNVNDRENEGVMYYWKRRYKYILSRWGYSVNIASFETFNELNQTLGYYDADLNIAMSQNKMIPDQFMIDSNSICPENRINYVENIDLKQIIREFHDYIVPYVKNILDDDKHMMNSSYGFYQDSNYNDLFDHSGLDFNSAHNYDDNINANSSRFEITKDVTHYFVKPFIFGECSTHGNKPLGAGTEKINTYEYRNNYDVSFHDEIWSSAMSGAMGTGLSWFWQTVFWWPDGNPRKFTYDGQTYAVLNGLGQGNVVTFPPPIGSITFINKTIYHQYNPLSEFFKNIDITQNYTPVEFIDNSGTSRVIYNVSDDKYLAYGWLQNLSNNWHNKWVMDTLNHNYFGCSSSSATEFEIKGLNAGTEYILIYYPTRMGNYALPSDFVGTAQSCSTSTGCLQVPVNFTLGCDTTNSNFAFILQPTTPLARTVQQMDEKSVNPRVSYIRAYPTLASGIIHIESNTKEKHEVEVYGSEGNLVLRSDFDDRSHHLNILNLNPGVYFLRIYNSKESFTEKIVVK